MSTEQTETKKRGRPAKNSNRDMTHSAPVAEPATLSQKKSPLVVMPKANKSEKRDAKNNSQATPNSTLGEFFRAACEGIQAAGSDAHIVAQDTHGNTLSVELRNRAS